MTSLQPSFRPVGFRASRWLGPAAVGAGILYAAGLYLSIAMCLGLFAGSMLIHQVQLGGYALRLALLEHPPGTSPVASFRGVHLPNFNGRCQFTALALRQYPISTSPQEVEAFYAQQIQGRANSEDFGLVFIENGALPEDLPPWFALPNDWRPSLSQLQGNVYLVYYAGYGDSLFDMRCS